MYPLHRERYDRDAQEIENKLLKFNDRMGWKVLDWDEYFIRFGSLGDKESFFTSGVPIFFLVEAQGSWNGVRFKYINRIAIISWLGVRSAVARQCMIESLRQECTFKLVAAILEDKDK